MGWLSEGVDAADGVDAAEAERVLAMPPALVEKSRILEAMGRGDPSAIEDIAAALSDEAAMGDIINDSDGPGNDKDREEGVEGVPECRWKFACPTSTSNGLPTPRLQPPPSATDLAGFPDSSTRPLAGDDPNPKLVPGPPGADDIDDLPMGPFPGFITGSVLAILLSGKPNPKSSFRTGFTPEFADDDPDVDVEVLDDGPEEDDLGDDGLSSVLALSRPSDLLARTSFSDSGLASSESLESTMGLGSAIP